MMTQYSGTVAIERRSLHDQIVDRIRDMIIEGNLEPGTRIDEVGLAEQLGVSRTPFREALRTLAAEGLIVTRRARGSVVRKFSSDDVRQMLELLGHIELLAGQLVCERASEEQVAKLLALHGQIVDRWKARDRMAYYKLNQEFHGLLARCSGNAVLAETQANLQARLKRIRFMGNREPEDWEHAVDEHEAMAEALRKRDGAALGAVMKQHLEATWDRVKHRV